MSVNWGCVSSRYDTQYTHTQTAYAHTQNTHTTQTTHTHTEAHTHTQQICGTGDCDLCQVIRAILRQDTQHTHTQRTHTQNTHTAAHTHTANVRYRRL